MVGRSAAGSAYLTGGALRERGQGIALSSRQFTQ
jgi:hypothetical protein